MLQHIYNYRIQHNKNIITMHSKWSVHHVMPRTGLFGPVSV